jgi:hypothetical protein
MMQLSRVNHSKRGQSANSRRAIWLAAGLMASWAAVAVVAPAATAQTPAANTPNANSAVPAAAGRLQALVRATATQLQIAYRYNAEEQQHRREQLAAAVAAWRAAARSAANDQLLADWLRAAIRKSMPGSREPLPAVPNFDRPVAVAPRAATTTAPLSKTSPSSTTRQKPVVENSGPAQVPVQSTQPRAEQSLIGREPAGRAAVAPVARSQTTSTDGGTAAGHDTEQDFWSAHPANGDLPADLTGDPFQDDPPSAGE